MSSLKAKVGVRRPGVWRISTHLAQATLYKRHRLAVKPHRGRSAIGGSERKAPRDGECIHMTRQEHAHWCGWDPCPSGLQRLQTVTDSVRIFGKRHQADARLGGRQWLKCQLFDLQQTSVSQLLWLAPRTPASVPRDWLKLFRVVGYLPADAVTRRVAMT